MDARLSNGNINQNIVTCPFHAAKFDITTGKKVGEPVLEIPPDMEPYLQSGKNIQKASAKRRHILKHKTRTHMKLLSKEIL
jgi:nitrite reductase/ring-hydroxylating ferredoxin subunit